MTSADFCRLMRLLILALHGVVLITIMRQVGCTALQVLFDVAGGIANAAKRDIAHRDITPNNFGQLDGRGYLYDFSAAKVSSIVNLEVCGSERHLQSYQFPTRRSICCIMHVCHNIKYGLNDTFCRVHMSWGHEAVQKCA